MRDGLWEGRGSLTPLPPGDPNPSGNQAEHPSADQWLRPAQCPGVTGPVRCFRGGGEAITQRRWCPRGVPGGVPEPGDIPGPSSHPWAIPLHARRTPTPPVPPALPRWPSQARDRRGTAAVPQPGAGSPIPAASRGCSGCPALDRWEQQLLPYQTLIARLTPHLNNH